MRRILTAFSERVKRKYSAILLVVEECE